MEEKSVGFQSWSRRDSEENKLCPSRNRVPIPFWSSPVTMRYASGNSVSFHVGVDVLTAMIMKRANFWNIME
jgi:hypothetical protein